MGAGNRYTLVEDNNELAIYIDTFSDCDEINDGDCYSDHYDDLKQYLMEVISKLPLCQLYGWDNSQGWENSKFCYYGEMYKVTLESGNHNEIVINLEFQDDFEYTGLQQHNYVKTYNKIARHINKHMPVCIGHGWTHSEYGIGEL